jgi:archaellum component FlaC
MDELMKRALETLSLDAALFVGIYWFAKQYKTEREYNRVEDLKNYETISKLTQFIEDLKNEMKELKDELKNIKEQIRK